jgi:hypothetical protein
VAIRHSTFIVIFQGDDITLISCLQPRHPYFQRC